MDPGISRRRNGRQPRWCAPRATGLRRGAHAGLRGCTSSIRTLHTVRRRRTTPSTRSRRTQAKSLRPMLRWDRCSTMSRVNHGEATHGVFAYESTLHVALILAQIHPAVEVGAVTGIVSDAPARHVDIVPTILDAITAAPAELPGRSLL